MKRVLKPEDDGVDIDRGFVHAVRPAAGLEPVATAAPRSVFDLGGPGPVEVFNSGDSATNEAHDRPLVCGIFNTGELLIEAPEHPPLRLSSGQTAALVEYLRAVQGGIR